MTLPALTSTPQLPFKTSIGPRSARIAFVGEAWGAKEDLFRAPFVGTSGTELARMIGDAGLTPRLTSAWLSEPSMIAHWHASGLFLTNTFAERPPGNKLIDNWCVGKIEAGADYPLPFIEPGKYIRKEFLHHLDRLYEELTTLRPNLVVALGNVACWALLGRSRISSIRGTVTWSERLNLKVLPTYHPASVVRNWAQRPIVVADLMKAKREMEFPEIRRPEREVLVSPTLPEIKDWMTRPAPAYAVDIETTHQQITMVGFARSRRDALVIPFFDRETFENYWPTVGEEVEAWNCVRALLARPEPKIFQNGLYDLSYLVRMGFRPVNCLHDTMLLHHSLFPEMPKGLAFMGSIYTNEAAWKLMRQRDDMNKREE